MFGYYLKTSLKVVLWHLIAQVFCLCIGFGAFGAFTTKYKTVDIIVSVCLTAGYAMYMYSKVYKVGERDTKSYAEEKPYFMKGAVLCVLLSLVSLLLAALYAYSFSAPTLFLKFSTFFPFRLWGYSYVGFMKGADGAITPLFWVLYFGVPLVSSMFGYISGSHRWEIGYNFFKNMVYRKKDSE